jgi:hypothetical protein
MAKFKTPFDEKHFMQEYPNLKFSPEGKIN